MSRVQHAFNLGPAGQPQRDVAAGPHMGHGRAALAGRDGSDDVDARDDGAEVVQDPAQERNDAIQRKRHSTPPLIENLLLGRGTEANPILDALLQPQ